MLSESAPRTRRLTALLLNVLLTAGALIGTVVLLEGGARLLGLRTGFFLHPTLANCERRSRLLSLEFAPSCAGDLADTSFRTNALGLRGDEVRADGSPRILTAGDSCTWGWRVEQQQSYPAQLEAALALRPGGARTQVINAGFPGYTSWQGVLYLRERGLVLAPAIVLIAFGFNDMMLEGGDIETQLAQQRRWYPFLVLDDLLLDRSTLYRWLRWNVNQTAPPQVTPRVVPEKYGDNLRAMIELARAHRAEVLLVDFLRRGGNGEAYVGEVDKVSAESGVPVVHYDGPRLDVVHPTATGYRLLAQTLAERLDAAGFLR